MDIQSRKERIMAWVAGLEDAKILAALEEMRNSATQSKESPLKLTQVQEEALEAAFQSYLSGNYLTSEQAMAEAMHWLEPQANTGNESVDQLSPKEIAMLNEARKSVDEGRFSSQEDVHRRMKAWLGR